MANALAAIERDSKAVGTSELDWRKIEATGRQYVAQKAASGRYQDAATVSNPKPTWDMIEGKEIVP